MRSHRSLLDRAVAVYNEGDLDGYVDLYTDDAVLTTPEGAYKGKGELRERFARELNALSDIRFDVLSYVEDDDSFADEFIFAGTHTGPLLMPDGTDLPATGRRVEIRGMEMVQVRAGRMTVDNLYYDNIALIAQLGLLPPSKTGHVELHAQLKIRPGRLETFKAGAAEMVRLARQHDTKTLRFDWYISDDGTRCEVHEVYADESGFFEHGQRIMQARAKLFADCLDVDGHHVTAFGDVPERIIEMANAHGNGLEHYEFLQGLQPTPAV